MKNNNRVEMIGRLEDEFRVVDEFENDRFLETKISIKRLSPTNDVLPIVVTKNRLKKQGLWKKSLRGKLIKAVGRFSSYSKSNKDGSHSLKLYVFLEEIAVMGEEFSDRTTNVILLDGYLCKDPIYRITGAEQKNNLDWHQGKEITDLLIATNRNKNVADYLPCITWGRTARFAQSLEVGDHIKIWGRIQSRIYQKKLETGETIIKTAYEISINKLDRIDEEVIELQESIDESEQVLEEK